MHQDHHVEVARAYYSVHYTLIRQRVDVRLGAQTVEIFQRQAYRTVLETAKRHNVAVMGGPMWDPTPENCRKSLDQGVTIFCLGLDTMYFRKICESTVDGLNAGVIGSGFTRPAKPRSAFK